jgi:CHASE3 domain sensor protein
LALVLFLGAVAWTFVAQRDAGDARRSVARTYEAIDGQNDHLTALVDAETGQHGFLLTGEERYLEPYEVALPHIERDLAGLVALTTDGSAQSARLAKLRRLVEAKLPNVERTIVLRRSDGAEAAAAALRTGRGKELMDAVRALLAELQAGKRASLDQRLARLERQVATATDALALSGLLALALGGTTGAVLLREARAGRRRAERALSEEEAHARAILDLNPQVLWTARPDGAIDDFAERWLEWTGLTRGQALGDGWTQVPHLDDLPRMAEAWNALARDG